MSYVLIGLTAGGAAFTGGGMLMKKMFGGGKGGSQSFDWQQYMPDWYSDPYYEKGQDKMYDFSSKLMAGESPAPLYESLVTHGGKEMEDLLSLYKSDITQSVEESQAKKGTGRSGVTDAIVSEEVGKQSIKTRWDDYLRAQAGKELFFKGGMTGMSDVTGKALTNQHQRNQFELAKATMGMTGMQNEATFAQSNANAQSAGWSDFLSSGIGAIGSMAGMYTGGTSTAAGADMTAALGGGNISGEYMNWKNPGAKAGLGSADYVNQIWKYGY